MNLVIPIFSLAVPLLIIIFYLKKIKSYIGIASICTFLLNIFLICTTLFTTKSDLFTEYFIVHNAVLLLLIKITEKNMLDRLKLKNVKLFLIIMRFLFNFAFILSIIGSCLLVMQFFLNN